MAEKTILTIEYLFKISVIALVGLVCWLGNTYVSKLERINDRLDSQGKYVTQLVTLHRKDLICDQDAP